MAVEDLVPIEQEYGERQQTVAMMNRAGLPLQTTAQTAGAPRPGIPASIPNFPVIRPANPNFDPLEGATPDDYPFLAAQRTPPPGSPVTPFASMRSQAKSDFVRAILTRLGADDEL